MSTHDTNPDRLSSPMGRPAIQPHLPSIPAFTEEDVRAYVSSNPVIALRIHQVGHATVSKVLFLPSAEASHLMQGASPGLRDEELVCYVELVGTFTFSPPNFAVQEGTHSPPLEYVHEVFDAQTGNLLMVGTGPLEGNKLS